MYNKLLIVQKSLSASHEDLIRFTKGVGQSLQLSGATSQTATGALLQLGQAMATGRVYAEELNSIIEGTPRLAKAIAEGIDEANGSIGYLKTLIKEGMVKSPQLFRAITSQLDKLDEEFKGVVPSIGKGFTVLENHMIRYVGKADKFLGVSEKIVALLRGIAYNLGTITGVAVTAAVSIATFYGSIKLFAIATTVRQLIAFQLAIGSTSVVTAAYTVVVRSASIATLAFTAALLTKPDSSCYYCSGWLNCSFFHFTR